MEQNTNPRWPLLREAVDTMMQDSSGRVLSNKEIDYHFIEALKFSTPEELDEAEEFLGTLDREGDIESQWFRALCGDPDEIDALVPANINQILNVLFEPGQ